MTAPTVAAESSGSSIFGVPVSSMQTDVSISDGKITGTLKYLSGNNSITSNWGEGNFLALKFTGIDEDTTSIMVGLEPSMGSGLVELINDPDKNGIFKVSSPMTQKFKMVVSDGTKSKEYLYDLRGLVCQGST